MTPNDPKLSDGGGWRGPCMAGGKVAAEARAVTAVAVRCSAWLDLITLRQARELQTSDARPRPLGECARVAEQAWGRLTKIGLDWNCLR